MAWRSTGRARRLIVALGLVIAAAACESGTDATVSIAGNTSSTAGTVDETTPDTVRPSEPFTYRIGMTSAITTTNYWRYLGTDTFFNNAYVLEPTKSAMFRIDLPSLSVVPALAKGLPAEPVAEGDVWTVTQPLRQGLTWSDGVEFTAADVVFTFEAIRDAGLGGTWPSYFPYSEESSPRLLDVEAVDDYTVTLTFDTRPDLATWPHSVGVGSIMSAAYWGETIAEALESDDPPAAVYGADAAGDPSLGGMVLDRWEEGGVVVSAANPDYPFSGRRTTLYEDGTVEIDGERFYGSGTGDIVTTHVEGPFVSQTIYSVYEDGPDAMLALIKGEIDYWIDPLGVPQDLLARGLDAGSLTMVVNPTNRVHYLAFNLRRSPGSYKGFRQAVAYMIDKELLTETALQDLGRPAYVMIPDGNLRWFNREFADRAEADYVGLSTAERLAEAVSLLKAEGFTWDVEPAVEPNREEIIPGSGIIDPAGRRVPEIEILVSADREAPARLIADWLGLLGVPATVNPTDVNAVAEKAWPGPGEEVTFDMYILGWTLGNAALPTFHESFWHSRNLVESNDGNNSTGFVNAEFDAVADGILAAEDEGEAYDLIWEAEAILADELPYVVLYNELIAEFHSKKLTFPFVRTLSGLQFGNGFASFVETS